MEYLKMGIAYLLIKQHELTKYLCEILCINKINSCICDEDLSSDELIIIIPKDKDTFIIQLISITKINRLKEKFQLDEKWIEVNKNLHEKIKKLSSANLQCTLDKGYWNIKLLKNEDFKIKIESKNIEAVILPNNNLGSIVNELYYIEN